MTKKRIRKDIELFSRRRSDFRTETFRAGGKGGQHQNKTDSAFRITDIETGLVAESREHKSQHRNKNAAFARMVDLLIDYYAKKKARKSGGNFGAENRIRTYSEVDDRIVDHDTGKKYSYKNTAGKKDLSKIITERAMEMAGGGSGEH